MSVEGGKLDHLIQQEGVSLVERSDFDRLNIYRPYNGAFNTRTVNWYTKKIAQPAR